MGILAKYKKIYSKKFLLFLGSLTVAFTVGLLVGFPIIDTKRQEIEIGAKTRDFNKLGGTDSWVNPTGYEEHASWTDESNMINNNTASGNHGYTASSNTLVEVYFNDTVECDKIRIFCSTKNFQNQEVDTKNTDIHVYYSGSYTSVCTNQDLTANVWHEFEIGSTETVSKARFSSQLGSFEEFRVRAFQFNDTEGGASSDTEAPVISVNFVGNTSDLGEPYYEPPHESAGNECLEGYMVNDSYQHEDYLFINATISDANLNLKYVQLYNATTDTWWANDTYALTNTGGNFYEWNSSTAGVYFTEDSKYSFNIYANDTYGNEDNFTWMKKKIGGGVAGESATETRRYVYLNNTPDDSIDYAIFYLYEAPYEANDPATRDRGPKDTGFAVTGHDTGYSDNVTPDATLHDIWCGSFSTHWLNESMCIPDTTLNNFYVHVWTVDDIRWDMEYSYALTNSTPTSTTGNSYKAINYTDARCNVSVTVPQSEDNVSLFTGGYYGLSEKITDNNLYTFYTVFRTNAIGEQHYSLVCNESVQSFIITNLPSNSTLDNIDTDNDGLTDYYELFGCYTNPFHSDTDGDGVSDYNENNVSGSDANNYTDTTQPPATWQQVQNWNITISNGTLIWQQVQNWNITLSNTTTLQQVEEINITLSNTSLDWNGVQEWNITLSNSSVWQQVEEWNITVSNTTILNQLQEWNITISNKTLDWSSIQEWNITLSNSSNWNQIQNWNITLSNTSEWVSIEELNITLVNHTLEWQNLQEINITLSNSSIVSWVSVDEWNITISNKTLDWNGVQEWNITLVNSSFDDWNSVEEINITISNKTLNWNQIQEWNITISNQPAWQPVVIPVQQTQTWNITLSNESVWTQVEEINITISNKTLDWTQIDDWNITLSNSSVVGWTQIDDWNITLSNSTELHEIQNWNITLVNETLNWQQIEEWNITLVNSSIDAWGIIDNWNITLSNTTTLTQLQEWNITLVNETLDWTQITDWNITLSNSSVWQQVEEWNITLLNSSYDAWQSIEEINITLSNKTLNWNQIQEWNITLVNGTDVWETVQEWNITIYNGSTIKISISNVYPSNNSNGIPYQPTLYATFNHSSGGTMNVSWFYGNSLTTCNTLLGSESSFTNATKTQLHFNATDIEDYFFRIQLDDGVDWINQSYTFTAGIGGGVMPRSSLWVVGIIFSALGIIALIFAMQNRKRRY